MYIFLRHFQLFIFINFFLKRKEKKINFAAIFLLLKIFDSIIYVLFNINYKLSKVLKLLLLREYKITLDIVRTTSIMSSNNVLIKMVTAMIPYMKNSEM